MGGASFLKFTEEARKKAAPIWDACLNHPFVKGIGDGSLDMEKFKYWVKQDYVYLKDFSRVFALGAAKAKDLATMGTFAKLLDGTLNVEMNLHRKYAAKFGISEEELESETPAPTTQAYTDFLVVHSYSGDLAELMAVLLPCEWGFWEIGTYLKEHGDTSERNPYRDWIEMYSSQEFEEFCRWCIELMDREAEQCPPQKREFLLDIFITSSRYEYLFWEMAYKLERWPV